MLLMACILVAPGTPILAASGSQGGAPTGVEVESVGPRGAGATAGLVVSDRLLAWRQADSGGAWRDLDGVAAWLELSQEWADRGPIAVRAAHSGETVEKTLFGRWRIEVVPAMPVALRSAWQDGLRSLEGQLPEPARSAWRRGEDAAAGSGRPDLAFWFAWRAGQKLLMAGQPGLVPEVAERAVSVARAWSERRAELVALDLQAEGLERLGRYPEARPLRQEALQLAEKSFPDSMMLAYALNRLAILEARSGDGPAAEVDLRRSLALLERIGPSSARMVETLQSLGNVVSDGARLEEAQDFYSRVIELLEKIDPTGIALAGAHNNLGMLLGMKGDLERSEAELKKALAVAEREAPSGTDAADALNNLGIVNGIRGDLAASEGYLLRAAGIQERLGPGSPPLAQTLSNIAGVQRERGDLTGAEELLARAISIQGRAAPDTLEMATFVTNLGDVQLDRAELDTAEVSYRRAYEIWNRKAPGGLEVALAMNNLGALALIRGDVKAAGDSHTQALAIREKVAPDTLDVAMSLRNLGEVARVGGEPGKAQELYRHALAIRERLASGSLCAAEVHADLGGLALGQGRLEDAARELGAARAIQEKLAPGTLVLATSQHALGRIADRRGRLEEAIAAYRQAVATLSTQVRTLGGSAEARSGFLAAHRELSQDLIDALLRAGRPDEAFDTFERSRAQVFLNMLARRDLDFSRDVPAELDAARRRLEVELERAATQLAATNPGEDAAAAATLVARVGELRDQRASLLDRLRETSPRLAALADPRPLDRAGAQAILEPGVLLLGWSLGEQRGVLFALTRDRLRAFPIQLSEAQARAAVVRFRHEILRVLRGSSDPAELESQGRELYRALLAPAGEEIASAKRLVLVPDGALHLLPFGALRCPAGMAGRDARFLVEWRPISTVLSASVLAELKRQGGSREAGGGSVVAFGDPAYPAAASLGESASPQVRAIAARFGLEPLPATRDEVAGIGRIFGESATTYVGAAATESQVKALGDRARILHFACHGLLDQDEPLSSALALAIPPRPEASPDNGLLQAWEVLEQVRIGADLVTLSACETALGKEAGGEGLISLTRAFQYAGARTVLASLWSVADESTAALMQVFYRELKSGQPKDEALRRAQLSLLQPAAGGASDFAMPYFWAAFQLVGDWQ
jgi:CHAT domain-containing protein/Tfp pilus assembly protein PilF